MRWSEAFLALGMIAGTALGSGPPGEGRLDALGDAVPIGTLLRIGTTRLQLEREIQAIAVSPDGKRVAATSDATLGVWEIADGREVYRQAVTGPNSGMLTFLPDGKTLACVEQGVVQLVDAMTGDRRHVVGNETDGANRVVALQAINAIVHVGSETNQVGTIERWDITRGLRADTWLFQAEPTLREGSVANYSVDFCLARDGKLLATLESSRVSKKQLVRLHDAITGAERGRWPVDSARAGCLAFSPDGRLLAAAGDTAVIIWETATGKERTRWKLARGMSTGRFALAFAPDGASVLATEATALVHFDVRDGKRLHDYTDAGGPIAFADNGRTVIAQGPIGALRIIDIASGKDRVPLPRTGTAVALAPDGRRVAWADRGAIVLGDIPTGKELSRWPAHERFVGPLAFSRDGSLLASAGTDMRIRVWDMPDGRERQALVRTTVTGLAFAPDGRRLVSTGNGDLCLWDVVTGKRLGVWYGRGDTPVMSADLRTLAIPDRQGRRLRLIEPVDGNERHVLSGYRGVVSFAVEEPGGAPGSTWVAFPPRFSADGRVLLTGGDGAMGSEFSVIQSWDVATGKQAPLTLNGNATMLGGLAFAPDGRLLAAMQADRRLCLLNTADGELVRMLGKCDHWLSALPLFAPDGRTLITTTRGDVQFWEVATGGEMVCRRGHGSPVRELVVSANGRLLATSSLDHTALVWDLDRLLPEEHGERSTSWDDLASPEARRGRRAVEALWAAPVEALRLLENRLRPAAPPEPGLMTRWLADLDSDDFAKRRAAEVALDRVGDMAVPALVKALAAKPPLEARRRMESLLKKLTGPTLSAEQLRAVRAVQVLEGLATPAAMQLLEVLARGAREARLTVEASAALQRLKVGERK
jgi:WD40 repeat protein